MNTTLKFSLFLFLFATCVFGDSTLVGHLLPLGKQHPPSIDISEFTLETAPKPKQFYENFVKPGRAAIFRKAMLDTKAFKLWTDDYLKNNYGDLEVRLEGKKERIHSTPIGEKYMGRDTIGHFIDNYHSPNSSTYIVSELPKKMYKDFGVIPSLGACGGMVKSFVEIDLWWSGGDTRSIMHKDAYNQINCLIRGTKHWKLFEYKYEKWLYKHDEGPNEVGGYSDINVDAVNLKKHPDFLKVPWSNFTINAGDCLYLPKSDYHQVHSDGPFNLAASILFRRFDHSKPESFDDCTNTTDYLVPRPLSDFDVMWRWSGKGVMSMGHGDLEESYRLILQAVSRRTKRQGATFNAQVLNEVFDKTGKRSQANFSEALNALDINKDGALSMDEINSLTFDHLRNFARIVEPYEPSNEYGFEYSFVTYGDVFYLLEETLKKNDRITRQEWIDIYQSRLKGTKEFAEEIFNGLAQSNVTDAIVSKDITRKDIKRALINWRKYFAPQYAVDDDIRVEDIDGGDDDDDINEDDIDDGEVDINDIFDAFGEKDEL